MTTTPEPVGERSSAVCKPAHKGETNAEHLRWCEDAAHLRHLREKRWLDPQGCGCRRRPDGTRWMVCRRLACTAEALACGGHCRECYDRQASVACGPPIVVLCGSTRFRADFEREQIRLALEGNIVLSVSCFGHDGDLPPEACIDGHPIKTALDELHKRKIDRADRVLVINPGGYIGSSTRSEIEYAEWFEKPIDYLVPIEPVRR